MKIRLISTGDSLLIIVKIQESCGTFFHQSLHTVIEMILLPQQSDKSLVDHFPIPLRKSVIIAVLFPNTTSTTGSPNSMLPSFSNFSEVSQRDGPKIMKNAPNKSCLLDSIPTFLLEECIAVLLPFGF